ncbi:hypothetical protein AX16_001089 [Volvariella volvacea WC 439]|nr:hypothetical protein AX16_001089 [Volvariella volvacea WC 439]
MAQPSSSTLAVYWLHWTSFLLSVIIYIIGLRNEPLQFSFYIISPAFGLTVVFHVTYLSTVFFRVVKEAQQQTGTSPYLLFSDTVHVTLTYLLAALWTACLGLCLTPVASGYVEKNYVGMENFLGQAITCGLEAIALWVMGTVSYYKGLKEKQNAA